MWSRLNIALAIGVYGVFQLLQEVRDHADMVLVEQIEVHDGPVVATMV